MPQTPDEAMDNAQDLLAEKLGVMPVHPDAGSRISRELTDAEAVSLREANKDFLAAQLELPTVQELFVRVMRGVESIAKTERNTTQNYAFRGVDNTMNTVGPLVREHGLMILPRSVDLINDERYETKGRDGRPGSVMRSVTVRVEWEFFGPCGDSLHAVTLGEAADAGDKAVPKAMSVAFRELWLKGLVVPTGDKDVDQEPTAERASEVVTTPGLVDQLRHDITLAETEDPGVREVWAVVQGHYDAGQLRREDYVTLRDVASQRITELQKPARQEQA